MYGNAILPSKEVKRQEGRETLRAYNAADARHVDFPKFGGKGVAIWW